MRSEILSILQSIRLALFYRLLVRLFFLTMTVSICSPYCNAGIDALVQYAAPPGSMSNVNAPAIIKDQAGGYMTGGSVIPPKKEIVYK